MKRTDILQTIIAQQKNVVQQLEDAKAEYKKGADIDENDTIDPTDLSQQDQEKDMQVFLIDQLTYAKQLLADMNSGLNTSYNTIEPGAIIVTPNRIFLTRVAFKPFDQDGIEYIGLSDDAPLFAELEGMKAGDSFLLNEETIEITEVL